MSLEADPRDEVEILSALPAAAPAGSAARAPAGMAPPPDLGLSGAARDLFERIYARIRQANAFADLLPELEEPMLEFLGAQRMTIYQSARDGKEIVSKFKTGSELNEIRLPLSPTSIAGFVALSQQPLRLDDVHDERAMEAIHPQLRFNSSYDRRSGFVTRSMLVVPIQHGKPLLGVLQVINKVGDDMFTDQDMKKVVFLARTIGDKFHQEFEGTNAPYEYLVKKGRVTQDQLEDFSRRTRKEGVTMTYLLVSELKIPPEMVAASLEAYYQIPFMRFDPKIELPRHLLNRLNLSYLRRQLWLPVAGDEDELVILIDNPSDVNRQMEIQRALPARKYIFRVGFEEDILQFLGGGPVSSYLHGLASRMEEETVESREDKEEGQEAGEINENESTVIQLVNRLIIDAQRAGASDIHVEPSRGNTPAKVRLRIDGGCREALEIPATHIRAVLSRIKIMARLDIAERRKPQDGKIMVRVRGTPLELRVATLPTVNGEGAVLRVLASGGALPFDKLNLSPEIARRSQALMAKPYGLFLVVGPTGSGKTTTLHAVLGQINTPDRKIWTAEDPVEITQNGLQQVQVEPRIGFNFAAALRAFLRADPDVILIGEMRDSETAQAGIEASLTGHLVFSTLHTNSAPETVTRLLDLGLNPLNFADALLGILAQRLVRTLCRECRLRYIPEAQEWERLRQLYGERWWGELDVDMANTPLYRAVGCAKCGKTGYRGRTGIHELLMGSDAIKKLMVRGGTVDQIRELALEEGMRTLMQDGVRKVIKGQIDLPQLLRVAVG
ncbi:MAG: GspE/PulE family protein [Magnetococcus sp. WYHC-3]